MPAEAPANAVQAPTKRFALMGAAGYIAPRHMKAIKENEGHLVAALDPNDSVGIIDSYFPDARFFTEFERFDRHVDKLRRERRGIDYVSICSPNYLHDAHMRFALRSHTDAICEKPLVLNPWNLDALQQIETESHNRIHAILQLRLHPSILALKKKVDAEPDRIWEVDLTYITSRGQWYLTSWKAMEEKSGGVATNIGVHFFDMLQFVFGRNTRNDVYLHERTKAAGYLEFARARVRWCLSIDRNDLPEQAAGKTTYRSIRIGDEELEFSSGFTDLHTESYRHILDTGGFGLDDVRPSIEITSAIRSKKIVSKPVDAHPLFGAMA